MRPSTDAADALLRRHVLGGPEGVTRLRERLGGRELAHAEVEHLGDAVVAEEDVRRASRSRWTAPFAWAAASPRATSMNAGTANAGREQTFARRACPRATAREALHHDVDRAVGHLVEVEHARHVRMVDVDLDVRLAAEAAISPPSRAAAPRSTLMATSWPSATCSAA